MKKKSKSDLDQIFIGTFEFCWMNVEVYGWRGQTGGWFYMKPDEKSPPRIKIGLGYKYWWEVVAVLLHEATEMSIDNQQCRFSNCGDHAHGSDGYIFNFNHNQFSEAVARVAYFVTPLLPELANVWKKYKPK